MLQTIIEHHFPHLAKNPQLKEEIVRSSELVQIKKGDVILKSGTYIKVIPFLVSGLVKIFKEDETGGEVLLYYIEPGESCVMSMTTLVKDEISKVKAIVEKDAEIVIIPAERALKMARNYPKWNEFFYDLFNLKFDELLHMVEVLTFSNKDRLLLEYLQKEATLHKSKKIQSTHQQIAKELGSSREVISRLLKKLEREGYLLLKQGVIQLVD
ncbi:Crp/Fnr family transcriptional regulator [uncultured Maribacter sp.]|uniref:Crp/Fnr family transcriptional regulator n=1 Tax=uncultured Maribacter sp. TaxID=431308 RepID=UPI002608EB15|nr:Crp/Fnr family transcriptional regulator [uncultured Maribacter sp.]